MTTHLSDNHGENDDHFLPGNGQVDWSAIAEAFPRETYSGPLMLEVVPDSPADLSPKQFMRLAHERAVWLREELEI